MPLTFPSHQGLLAPLWRRWPGRFHVLALCWGAAVPDVVDGALGAWRGYLGQSYGHSLVGLLCFCLPTGLLLTWLALLAASFWKDRGRARWLSRAVACVDRADRLAPGLSRGRRLGVMAASVLLGGCSHLLFDFLSHGNFLWLYPWYESRHFFPAWWYIRWFEVWAPGYREPYPLGPHFVVWACLSLLGIVLLFRPSRENVPPCGAGPRSSAAPSSSDSPAR
jgi:hypothetical protein